MHGETLASGAPRVCEDCDVHLVLEVHHSGGGYYIGTRCDCGPYSRESGYYKTEEAAQAALETGNYGR